MLAHETHDVLVVGARCAGAATAMLMARQGLRVLVVDRGGYGTDTTSTHALMRGGVLQLHRWGVLSRLRKMGTPAVRQTTFHYGNDTVAIPIQPSNGVDALYAPRRTLLDSALVDAARAAGAVVRHGQSLFCMTRRPDGRISGATIQDTKGNATVVRAGLIVGADGINSSVARIAGAETVHEARNASACIFGYFPGIRLTGYHWWFRPGVAAGAIPTNRGQHCVFVSLPAGRLRSGPWRDDKRAAFHAILREAAPELAEQVAREVPAEPLSVFAGHKGFMRQAAGPGWALVGDAGYFKDPLTAHGITDALRDAELLANAAADGSRSAMDEYAETRDALSMPLFEASDEIAGLDWDMDRIQALHQTLNHAMKREVAHLLTFDDPASAASSRKATMLKEAV